jgi:hypothetical protein
MADEDEDHFQNLIAAISSRELTEEDRFEKVKIAIENGLDISDVEYALKLAKRKKYLTKIVEYLEGYISSVKNSKTTPSVVKADNFRTESVSDQSNENGSKRRQSVSETDFILDEIQENGFNFRKSVNIPPDGSCQFWAFVLAYLIPVKDDQENFERRFKNLFDESPTGILYYILN